MHARPSELIDGTAEALSESSDDPPLTLDAAAALMSHLGFLAFTARSDDPMPESCLMAVIRDAPTLVHFDPEVITYWALIKGHGHLESIDRATALPISLPFSWGRIHLVDRLGVRNSFVSFGGQLMAREVGPHSTLVILTSPAPILRLPGHSQRADELAEDVVTFFARLVPHLWDAATERLVGTAAPEALYAAFLVHQHESLARRPADGDGPCWRIHRDVGRMARARPNALVAGGRLLARCGLEGDGRQPAIAR